MIKSSRFGEVKNIEGNLTKDVRNLFGLTKLKKTIYTTIKGIRKLFKLKN